MMAGVGGLVRAAIGSLLVVAAESVMAGKADVVDARLEWLADGRARVHATIEHNDEGWSHYADRFEVLAEDGALLVARPLAHPHVHEQPFTRSSDPFCMPDEVTRIRVRARDSRHGYGGTEAVIDIERQAR